MTLVLANGVGASMVIILAIAAGIVLVVGGSAVWLAVVRGRGLVGLVGISAVLIAYFVARFPLTLSLTTIGCGCGISSCSTGFQVDETQGGRTGGP